MGAFRFGEFELDVELFVVRRRGEVLPMQPKIFDVLHYLIEHRDRVVTKPELLHEIWRDDDVFDGVVAWSVSHIRRALGQRGGRHPIETVHGGGYRFTAELSAEQPVARPRELPAVVVRPLPPLVGRVQVMKDLVAQAETAASGVGSLSVISGEGGIGKTRCADQLAVVARNMDMVVLSGRCPQELAVPALWPVTTALLGMSRELPELAARARKLAQGPLEDGAGSADVPGAARFRLIEQCAELLRAMAAQRPSLLILDDLHCADAGTIDLLSFIAPELRDLPLCIVATLRGGELRPGAERTAPLRRVLRHARTIPLGAFAADEVAELAQLIGKHRPSDALAEALCRAAGGIPLFVHEIVRSLLRQHGEQALARLGPDAVAVPALARDLLRERVQRLPESTRELLSNAAVIGESFDLSLLRALCELEPEALLERLEPALLDGHVLSEAPHAYRFGHSLFQSLLYDDLPAAQRVTTHRRLAGLLLARSDPSRHQPEAARHLYLALPAADPEQVLEEARRAGQSAQRAFAYENAIVYFGWALEAQLFASEIDASLRAELLLALGTAQRMAGRTRDALETSSRLLELAQQRHMHEVVVRATRLRRPTVAMSMIPDALARAALEGVLEQLADEPSPARVSALSQLACIPPYSADLARSKELSGRALELAARLPDAEPSFEGMRARLFSLSGPDDIAALLQLAERMLSAAADGPSAWHAGDALTARHAAYILAGRIAEADEVLQQMSARVGGRHLPEASFFHERLALQRRFLDGHFDEADQGWKALHASAVRAGVSYADMFYAAHSFNLALEREGPQVVIARMQLGPGFDANMTPYTRAGFARHAADAGEIELARSMLSALGDPQGFPRDGHYLHLLANFAACASRIDDKPRCEQLLALLAPYAELNTPSQMGYYMGSVAHFLGLLATALGRDALADEHFTRAHARNLAMGYRAGVARTLLAHGKLALRGAQPRRARELLAAALRESQALGMRAIQREAEVALNG